MKTFTYIDLDYRPKICGCCFAVSWDGLVLCCSPKPILDSARILKKLGMSDDTIINLRSEGSEGLGVSYSLSSALSGMICDVGKVDSTPTERMTSDVDETDDIPSEGMVSQASEAERKPRKLH